MTDYSKPIWTGVPGENTNDKPELGDSILDNSISAVIPDAHGKYYGIDNPLNPTTSGTVQYNIPHQIPAWDSIPPTGEPVEDLRKMDVVIKRVLNANNTYYITVECQGIDVDKVCYLHKASMVKFALPAGHIRLTYSQFNACIAGGYAHADALQKTLYDIVNTETGSLFIGDGENRVYIQPLIQVPRDVDYKKMTSCEMIVAMGVDCAKWADAFQQIIVDPKKEIDEGLMIGWFANAIEAGCDSQSRKEKRENAKIETQLDFLVKGLDAEIKQWAGRVQRSKSREIICLGCNKTYYGEEAYESHLALRKGTKMPEERSNKNFVQNPRW